jgi:beta-lactamase regulating signal transducer with metallopeptidase domain
MAMSDAGTLFSFSTLAALAVSHLWQSVAVAAALAGILILGRRMSGAARYALACAAMAAAIILPLAMFAPGAGARAVLLGWLKAPLAASAPVATRTPAQAVDPAPSFGLDMAQMALNEARRDKANSANSEPTKSDANVGVGVAQLALDAARRNAASDVVTTPAVRSWGKPLADAPKAAKKPFWSGFSLPKLPDLRMPFLVIWLAGALILLVRVGRDLFAAEQLVKRARTIPLPVELAKRLGRVRLAISPDAPGPMAAGLFHPSVILPEGAIQRIGAAEMAALLEHELAHIERRDVLAALAQRIAIALLWWSPAMYWISRRIDEERESACDETAVLRTGDARAFARSLTSQAETQLWARAPKMAAGAIGRRSQFSRRIKRLVEMARAGGVPAHYSGRLAFTGLALAVAIAAFLTPKLAIADVPRAPPADTSHAAPDKSGPLPLTPAPGAGNQRLDGAAARQDDHDRGLDGASAGDDSASNSDGADFHVHADLGDLGLQLADLGVDIGSLVSEQVAANVPVILDQVRDQLHDQGVNAADWNDLGDADRERLRAEMERVRDELRDKFGPEFREKIKREVERAQREVERAQDDVRRSRADWSRGEEERRRAMAAAHEAIARAHAEIEAARARGDFDFGKFADKSWAGDWAGDWARDWGRSYRKVDVSLKSSPDRQLMEAANDGDIARVRTLLKADADPDRAFPGDGSALIAAARRNHVDVLRALLDAGADVDRSVRGDGNALIAAAQRGNVDAARVLLEHGADVDAYVPGDETPLIAAAANGELGVVKLLVEHHADVNLAYRVMGRLRSPLGMAQARGYDDVAAYLRAHGAVADPKASN